MEWCFSCFTQWVSILPPHPDHKVMSILPHTTAKSRHHFPSRAGLMVPATLLKRLGIGETVDRLMPAFKALERRGMFSPEVEIRVARASLFTAQAIAWDLVAIGKEKDIQEIREFISTIVPGLDTDRTVARPTSFPEPSRKIRRYYSLWS